MSIEDIQIIDDIVDLPLVSIIMATYNRSLTIGRAVNSVINQSYKNIELIIIDDGSTDNTIEILNNYKVQKIKLFRHESNKGVTAAKNSGLNQIKGEWFTILDSDDEITPDAIATMMKLPLVIDKTITAVSCNCWDTSKKAFSGNGIATDQYIDVNILMTVFKGEFWGITKSSLLQGDRFNENLRGIEATLWYKINERAKRFYIHKALRIWHTEGEDRIMKSKYSFRREVDLYTNLIEEKHYLATTKKYIPIDYRNICKNGLITMKASNKKKIADRYYQLIDPGARSMIIKLIYKYKAVAKFIKQYIKYKMVLKPYLSLLAKTKK